MSLFRVGLSSWASPSESSRWHRASAARVSGTERQVVGRTGTVHGGLELRAEPAEGGAAEAEPPRSQGVGRRQAGSSGQRAGGRRAHQGVLPRWGRAAPRRPPAKQEPGGTRQAGRRAAAGRGLGHSLGIETNSETGCF